MKPTKPKAKKPTREPVKTVHSKAGKPARKKSPSKAAQSATRADRRPKAVAKKSAGMLSNVMVQKASPKPRKRARPVKFTPALGEKILGRMAGGESLRAICRSDGMPTFQTILRWVNSDEDFRKKYETAVDFRAQGMFEEILEIADEVTENDTIETKFGGIPNKEWIMRSKLRVDARKWILARMAPKKYGDKVTQEISGPDGKPIRSESSHRVSEDLQDAILQRIAEAQIHANKVEPPASWRGENAED